MRATTYLPRNTSKHDAWFRRQVQIGLDSANAGNLIPAAEVEADNPAAALTLDELFAKNAECLLAHPDLGRIGRVRGTRGLGVRPNYVLIYDLIDNKVRVLRVTHAARQWP